MHTRGPWSECAPEIDGIVDERYRIITCGAGYEDEDGKYRGFTLAGFVSRADARLIAAAPLLYELARQYASECACCDGSGHTSLAGSASGTTIDCPDCAHISAVLAKVTGTDFTPTPLDANDESITNRAS